MSRFITIEGIEGAGKSTLRSRLSDFAASLSLEVVITREPGATVLGQSVRSIVLDPKNKKIHPVAELMLFCADRAQHLEEVVRPALERGAKSARERYLDHNKNVLSRGTPCAGCQVMPLIAGRAAALEHPATARASRTRPFSASQALSTRMATTA